MCRQTANTLLLISILSCASIHAQLFTKVTGDPVVSDDRYSEGSSWGDINADGYPDLFVPDLYSDKKNILFINNQDGSFTEVTNGPVVTDVSTSTGGYFGDLDNDGDSDLFVSNFFGNNNFLYLNDGSGNFLAVFDGNIVSDGGNSFGASLADYDNDGHLDIYVVNGFVTFLGEDNFLYRNNGDGTFTRIVQGPHVMDGKHSSSASWCDYDTDGDADLFVANGGSENAAEVENTLYQNNGDGTFTEIDLASIGLEHSYSSNGAWADYDNDGDFDLYITNFLGNDNILYQNDGDGTFTRISTGIVVNDGGDSVSSAWADYDNDGDLDLFVTNDYNENNNLYENNGDGTFTKITDEDAANDGGRSNGATWADVDRDGFPDLFVPNGQRPLTQANNLYLNNAISGNNWIVLNCRGLTSNASAIGTRIRVLAMIGGKPCWQLRQVSGATGFNAQNSLAVVFGLAGAQQADSVIVEWPSGLVDRYSDVQTARFYEATEGIGLEPAQTSIIGDGSTPYVFELNTNYPNPFNSTTVIRYSLSARSYVHLAIYDIRGRRTKTAINARQSPGNHEYLWDGRDNQGRPLASGVYFGRLTAGAEREFDSSHPAASGRQSMTEGATQTIKMVLMK